MKAALSLLFFSFAIHAADLPQFIVPGHQAEMKALIQMQAYESEWLAKSVVTYTTENSGELRFTVHRRDGGSDQVLRRFPGQPPVESQGETTAGELVGLSADAKATPSDRLEIRGGGEDSVAKPSLPANSGTAAIDPP